MQESSSHGRQSKLGRSWRAAVILEAPAPTESVRSEGSGQLLEQDLR
jgi:hypothetical protein